jgi:hypothetical protein
MTFRPISSTQENLMAARRPNDFYQDRLVLPYDHVQLTADTTIKLWKVPRRFRIDRVMYINQTGLAQDATNFFAIKLMNGATVMASWSTETGQQGTLTADTFVQLVNSGTDANLVAAADDVLSVQFDESGTATLPAGRLVIEGRYV